MTIGVPLRHWSSLADPGTHAVEFLPGSAGRESLSHALARVAHEVEGNTFLIVRIDEVDHTEIHRAVNAFQRAAGGTRLCLAGNHSTLDRLRGAPFDRDRVGWMLDDIDVTTPLSEIISERIEAIRFRPDFVGRAGRNMRLGFVLDSMLLLARDLGLCALGSNDAPGAGGVTGRREFDYLPVPSPRSTLPVARGSALHGSRSGHAITRGR
jgi:hypothetical protein